MKKIDFRSQRIVSELDKFYAVVGKSGRINRASVMPPLLYSTIYNFLKEENTLPDYPPDVKQELWQLAQQSLLFNKDKKEKINDYYKSYLVCRYLVDKMPERMFIYDESGKRITRIELTIK